MTIGRSSLTGISLDPTFVIMVEHGIYRNHHETLHLVYQSACVEPCPVRDHILLQARCAAVRIAEEGMR